MGSEVLALCECGIKKSIRIGGGMRTFKHTQYFPFACFDCNDVIEANLLENPQKCSRCGSLNVLPYDDSRLSHFIVIDNEVARNFDHVLYKGTYKCARCENDTLEFLPGGRRWD
jgi:DNA-directed RNA polymerase subunit RPC12/RpoP